MSASATDEALLQEYALGAEELRQAENLIRTGSYILAVVSIPLYSAAFADLTEVVRASVSSVVLNGLAAALGLTVSLGILITGVRTKVYSDTYRARVKELEEKLCLELYKRGEERSKHWPMSVIFTNKEIHIYFALINCAFFVAALGSIVF